MSEEKRIDRLEKVCDQNTKEIGELRLIMTETLSKIMIDNAETRETLHKGFSKLSRDNAILSRWLIAASAVGGAVAGIIAILFGK
ncbi:hypothetical protein [Thioalkalivibrio sp. HK1]|uniref:hypothetical protein n=1 Tax=Thioalkalivibrio sp. HK1 TaxID=1469245 RepID=UPI000471A8E1|nr:hypothetical protein [Thioalkalivibrio sp. HK1]